MWFSKPSLNQRRKNMLLSLKSQSSYMTVKSYMKSHIWLHMWLHIWSHIWSHICDFIIYEVTVIYNVFKRDLKSADYLFCYLFIYLNDYYCYYYTKYLLNMAMTDFKNNFTTLKSCKVVFCNSNVRPLFHTSPHGYLCFLMMLFLHI